MTETTFYDGQDADRKTKLTETQAAALQLAGHVVVDENGVAVTLNAQDVLEAEKVANQAKGVEAQKNDPRTTRVEPEFKQTRVEPEYKQTPEFDQVPDLTPDLNPSEDGAVKTETA